MKHNSPVRLHKKQVGYDYSIFGECFYVSVPMTIESSGQLFWLNKKWFVDNKITINNAKSWDGVEKWILDNFSLVVSESNEKEDHLFARADRYGGLNGTVHGGSGRCVYYGLFNVKGVGRTPLVPNGIHSHNDGQYLLVEAIRGAVYAELANSESIAGAIRTIAIIELPPFESDIEERRCLILRENFLRPAHFERSLLFGSAGHSGSDQSIDHKRVTAVREKLKEQDIQWFDIARNLAFQMGSLDAMRMSQGRFTSSNMSIFGEVADFETFRIFNSWFFKKQENRDNLVFGKELDLLKKSARRWAKIFASHERSDIVEVYDLVHRQGFKQFLSKVLNLREASMHHNSLIDLMYEVFLNNKKLNIKDRDAWLTDDKIHSTLFAERMIDLCKSIGFDEQDSLYIAATLNSWRISRSEISLRNINNIARSIILIAKSDLSSARKRIDSLIWKNRRVCFKLPQGYAPIMNVYTNGNRVTVAGNVFNRRTIVIKDSISSCEKTIEVINRNGAIGFIRSTKRKSAQQYTLFNKWMLNYLD